jgi:hypothetical protein
MKGNVLAVEANMVATFYISGDTNGFSPDHCYNEIAGGKRFGDAIRQHGSTFATHVLFGDPLLSLNDSGSIKPHLRFSWPYSGVAGSYLRLYGMNFGTRNDLSTVQEKVGMPRYSTGTIGMLFAEFLTFNLICTR